ncbi:D-alanyl-D-alanine carboxypeptidase DacB [Acaryochloris thomasi RCC1774]|uniref:D-alanyl-D-alanine carboxypeptidase DacB n=1 Tax=Acaryochloris thomasi RCC1774 TaxID=1764569 RepID=A0A2W1JX03_9CYAN|nr:D-alanyl-D-alanine carboxypeptidase [Acaryochloris thomasi]PZD74164.1 D-alanyl-D-alanine carboxypeptidase DacB [Acaryochloris thomasi RCC1774]
MFATRSVTLPLLCLGLYGLGCSKTAPIPEPDPKEVSSPTVQNAQPLNLTLQQPKSVENSTIDQYLGQLAAPRAAQGVWIQSSTQLLANHQGTVPLPAASITKVATSLAALKKLGPRHRFNTVIGTTGPIKDGVLQGDLVIQGGADPLFVWEDAIATANLLSQKGIQRVSGNLIIQGPFYMNFKTDPQQTGELLKQSFNAQQWPPEAATQYQTLKDIPKPQLEIQGNVQVAEAVTPPTIIHEHPSLPLAELLKRMNRYSNNAMAEMLAQEVGGAQVVAQTAAQAAGVPQSEIQLINGSGLGVENRMSPRAACGVMFAIANLLHPQQMNPADILAIPGKDIGILDSRPLPQQAILKSGTLNRVSALAGAIPTQKQDAVWFVLLNGEGNIALFRSQQEALLQTLIAEWEAAAEIPPSLKPTPLSHQGR